MASDSDSLPASAWRQNAINHRLILQKELAHVDKPQMCNCLLLSCTFALCVATDYSTACCTQPTQSAVEKYLGFCDCCATVVLVNNLVSAVTAGLYKVELRPQSDVNMVVCS